MLRQIKDYLMNAKTANMAELCQMTSAEPDAVRGMLSHWQRHGKVVAVGACGSACASSCGGCNPLVTERYRWCD